MTWLPGWWRGALEGQASITRPWRRVVKVVAVIAAVLSTVLIGANLLLGADWAKARVAAHIKDQTGHELSVDGPTRLLFLPGPRIVISDATIASPGAAARSEATARSAELSIATLTIDLDIADLFGGAIDIERVVLEHPVLTLQRGLTAKSEHSEGATAPATSRFARAQLGGGMIEPDRDLVIEELQIVDGTVIVGSLGRGPERRIEHIDASISLPTLKAPVVGYGTFEWKRKNADFSFQFATPADLRATRQGKLNLAIDTDVAATRFEGSVWTAPHFSGEGRLAVKAHSVPSLLAWLSGDTRPRLALGDGEFDGTLAWSRTEITLHKARFANPHMRGEGEAIVSLGAGRPHIRAAIGLDHLDLTPFFDAGPNEGRSGQAQQGASTPPQAGAPQAPTDWFSKPAAEAEPTVSPPQAVQPGFGVRAPRTAQKPLSLAEPMPEEALARARKSQIATSQTGTSQIGTPRVLPATKPALFDADVNLNMRKVRLRRVDMGPGALSIDFDDGVLEATLNGMALYDGTAGATLTMDTKRTMPRFEGEVRLEDVQAMPLLADAAEFTMVSGRTKLRLSIAGEGKDGNAIKSSLKGNGAFVVSDGAIEGVDITAFIRALGKGKVDLRQGPDAKTAFSALGGSFTIGNGFASTRNLKMQSPLLEVKGNGDVDLQTDTLRFRATPEIVAGPEGADGANELAGLSVPVLIEGPLDRPRIQPEISAVFANPESASRAVKKIGAALQKKFKDRPVGEFIGRLLSGAGVSDATPQALAPQGGSDAR